MVRALIELAGGAIAGCAAVMLLSGTSDTFASFGPEPARSRAAPDLDSRAELLDSISELAAGRIPSALARRKPEEAERPANDYLADETVRQSTLQSTPTAR